MKKISFQTSEDRALELIRFFNSYNDICDISYTNGKVTFEFDEMFTDVVVQGIFHAGISIGLQVNLIQKL
jgi:hypothetical protein